MELVTGGAGFIGSHIVERLLREGRSVRVFDNFSSGDRSMLGPLAADVEFVEGDLRDAEALRQATQGVDTIFHLGAEPSVQRSVADPQTCIDINVSGTMNVLLGARDAGVRRVVFASTCAVYGDDPVMPKIESMALTPGSPYAASKAAGEHLCKVASAIYGVEAVSLRFFNVFGPRQRANSAYAAVIPIFLDRILRGEQPLIYGDGRQTRDFVYIDNVVDANLAAATAPGASGQVFNVATGVSVSLLDLLGSISTIIGRSVEPRFEPSRAGDIVFSEADISAARTVLGYVPRVAFLDGLQRTIESLAQSSSPVLHA
ncbi:SDR family oxidoreductase [soil metagenome]